MRRLIVVLTTITLGVGMTLVPGTASAATGDFGNGCTASSGSAGTGVMTAKGATNPLPITAPATGIITQATIALPTSGLAVVLKTLRPTGNPNEYTVISESAGFTANVGTQSYPVRVPVTAGDLLGMTGSAGALQCSTGDPADIVATIASNPAVGVPATYTPTTGRAISMIATVEADVDKDGYGDVTQDKCPQSAALQTPCPTIKLDTFAASQGGSITVLVSTDNQTDVKVAGTAKVGAKKVKLKGGTQTIKSGALARFKIKIPATLRNALADLPPNKSIKVSFTATATDLVGRVSKDKCSVRLPGTG